MLRAVLSLALLCATPVCAQKLITPGYLFNSDPTCHQIGNTFYLFTTQDPFTVAFQRPNTFYRGMYAYHAFSTQDFDHWVDHGSILTSRDVSWNAGSALWDGDAGIGSQGRFYAYAPFRMNSAREENYGQYAIGAFSAPGPVGPYHDVLGGPMRNVDGAPLSGLSPFVVAGDDGSHYLLWGAGDTEEHAVWLAPLKANMVELAQAPRRLRVPEKDACGNLDYFESPLLFKAGSRWYLTYVAYKDDKGPQCDPKGSYVQYTVADNMWGPFDTAPRRLINRALDGQESTQQGICRYRGEWYLAYHVPYDDVGARDDHHRQVAVTRLGVRSDGSLEPVDPATDPGVGTPDLTQLTLDAFAVRREAAEFHVRYGVEGVPGLAGEYRMKMKNGGYLQFNRMDFGAGARGFRAEASAAGTGYAGGVLEIRLDRKSGPLIGTLRVNADEGGAPTSGRMLATRLATPVRGVHDLLLVARGELGGARAVLFDLTWFAFDARSPTDSRSR